MNPLVPVLLAMLGAVFLSAGTILQWLGHEGARRLAEGESCFCDVFRRTRWWCGIASGTVGTLLHYAALWLGALALVQPIGALHIALTALWMARQRREALMGPRLWGIVAVTLGTALCLAGEVSVASGQEPSTTGSLLFAGLLAVASLASLAMPRPAGRFAVLSGIAYTVSAVAWKAFSETGTEGAGLVWAALFAVGYAAGFLIMQAGFRRGGAGAVNALAAGTATALPMAGAVLVFGEEVHAVAWLGVGMIAFGVLLVGRVVARFGGSQGG
jgi:uncharacterized membrane protein